MYERITLLSGWHVVEQIDPLFPDSGLLYAPQRPSGEDILSLPRSALQRAFWPLVGAVSFLAGFYLWS